MNFLDVITDKLNNLDFENPVTKANQELIENIKSNPMITPAKYLYEHIISTIKELEASLNGEQEIGVKISFMSTDIYYVQEIEYLAPYILIFRCLNKSGNKAILMQHYSQLNFLFVILPKLKSNQSARRIGFKVL